jgi:hypothetical protein
MGIYVLKSVSMGQTRYVSRLRNGTPRIIAFKRREDARVAVNLMRRELVYSGSRIDVAGTNHTQLAREVSEGDVAIDLCTLADNDLALIRSLILRRRPKATTSHELNLVRDRLEKEYGITISENS